MNLLIKNSTSTNFIPIALKFVLVEFVLVKTVLVGDPLYMIFDINLKSSHKMKNIFMGQFSFFHLQEMWHCFFMFTPKF